MNMKKFFIKIMVMIVLVISFIPILFAQSWTHLQFKASDGTLIKINYSLTNLERSEPIPGRSERNTSIIGSYIPQLWFEVDNQALNGESVKVIFLPAVNNRDGNNNSNSGNDFYKAINLSYHGNGHYAGNLNNVGVSLLPGRIEAGDTNVNVLPDFISLWLGGDHQEIAVVINDNIWPKNPETGGSNFEFKITSR